MLDKSNQFRIIGGKWRRRLLPIAAHEAVRPTPNRVRETLFNWLMHDVKHATCLDAFAGSGALGLEALSRGARQVYFIEHETAIIRTLQQHCKTLGCTTQAVVIQDSMPEALATLKIAFDIVFIDPPFYHGLIPAMLTTLLTQQRLKPHAWIYVEAEVSLSSTNFIDDHWQVVKSGHAGQVAYYLLQPVV